MYRLCPSWSQPWILKAHHYGWPIFCFWDNQTIECIVEEVEIQYLTPHDDYDQLLPPLTSYRVSGENTDICGIWLEVHIGECQGYG